ncbi:unnamed protein product [Paramecium pentaurelia]|uniref:Peptidase S54 rhomboid domain-containing protein n=1 Tax=Paramecium pentaurelia TaxID=43138 RepID=A0A8S1TT82_9CILI|nr:unnamed protein product [Paramecium pentaurelia]
MNIPKKTIFQCEIWRILIPQFFHGNLFNLSVSLLGFMCFAIQTEKKVGSVQFFFDLFIKNLIIQIIFVSFCYGFSYLDEEMLIANSFGFWNLSFIYQMRRALNDEEETQKFLCFSFNLPQKYFPALFFLTMNFIRFPRLDLVGATIFSFIENQFFDGFSFRLTSAFQKKCENCFPFKYFSNRLDFFIVEQIEESFDSKKQSSSVEFGIISTIETKPKQEKSN